MMRKKKPLGERVASAAEKALAAQDFVSSIDVFAGIGWLPPSVLASWRRGQLESLETAMQVDPSRIAQALRLLESWARNKGLSASQTDYVARTPQRQVLRFSVSGEAATENAYRTHWLSQNLPEKKRERLAEKASRAPDLVVIVPSKSGWTCHRCGGTGDLLIMENPGPACMHCVGLNDLEFLPAGDALLSRRVKARSKRCAVVVSFSRTRGRYERQGLLAEPLVLADAQRELEAQRREQ